MQSKTTKLDQSAPTGAIPSAINSPNHQPSAPQSGEPLPNSRRVYVPGKLHPTVRVPFREIRLAPTKSFNGRVEANAPVRVYDCSGPWGDPAFNGKVEQGLPPLRRAWILARGDVEETEPSYRPVPGHSDAAIPPSLRRKALRAKPGKAVTQLHYARRGIITPEMEFIAIRENLGRERPATRNARPHPAQFGRRILRRQHPRLHHARIRPQRSRPRPGDHSGQHQPPRERADDHRAQFPGEDQRQHRQQRGGLEHRGGSREDALGDQVGRGHGDGSFHRQEHPRDARVDHPQLARAHRHGADLPGAGKGGRQGRGADLGSLSRHADRAMRAGRGLLHRPRRRACCATSR